MIVTTASSVFPALTPAGSVFPKVSFTLSPSSFNAVEEALKVNVHLRLSWSEGDAGWHAGVVSARCAVLVGLGVGMVTVRSGSAFSVTCHRDQAPLVHGVRPLLEAHLHTRHVVVRDRDHSLVGVPGTHPGGRVFPKASFTLSPSSSSTLSEEALKLMSSSVSPGVEGDVGGHAGVVSARCATLVSLGQWDGDGATPGPRSVGVQPT